MVGRNWFRDEPKVASGLKRFPDGHRCRIIRTVSEETAIDQRHEGPAVVILAYCFSLCGNIAKVLV